MTITVTDSVNSQPVVVAVGKTPTQLPIGNQGITVVNTGNSLINVSTDPHVQQGIFPVQPGSSISLPRAGSYWAMSAVVTTLIVLEGNQTYFSTASLQSQGLVGQSGGLQTLSIAVPMATTVPFPKLGATANLQLWNLIVESTGLTFYTTGQGLLILTTGVILDGLSPAEASSNRVASLIIPNGGVEFTNNFDNDITAHLLVSPHS